jgi:hypothetical protein
MIAEGGNSEPGDVKENRALNLPFLGCEDVVRSSVCESRPAIMHRINVKASTMVAADTRSRREGMLIMVELQASSCGVSMRGGIETAKVLELYRRVHIRQSSTGGL